VSRRASSRRWYGPAVRDNIEPVERMTPDGLATGSAGQYGYEPRA
jgi:hypothetical protein